MITTNMGGENEFTNQKMDYQVKEDTDVVEKLTVDHSETDLDEIFPTKSEDHENMIPESQDGEMKTTNTVG